MPPLRLPLHRALPQAVAPGGGPMACSRPSWRPSKIRWALWEHQHRRLASSPLLPQRRPRKRLLLTVPDQQGQHQLRLHCAA